MGTTPRRILVNLHFILGWKQLEVLTVVRELGQSLRLDVIQRVGEGHVAMTVVMAVRLAIGGDMAELRSGLVAENAEQTLREDFTVFEQAFESDAARNGGLVKEDRYTLAGWQALHIRASRVDLGFVDGLPFGRADSAHACCLMRSEHCELDALISKNLERGE